MEEKDKLQQEDFRDGDEYDGIEYDNESRERLPVGFILLALVLIAFAVYYLPAYLPIISGWTQEKEFEESLLAAEKQYFVADVDSTNYELFFGDNDAIEAGKSAYLAQPCGACHGMALEGGIGPALNDSEWLYGGDAKSIYKSIEVGRPKGMPQYKGQISKNDMLKITAYLHAASNP